MKYRKDQVIRDSSFNDSGSWLITNPEGTAVVTGGQLVCTGWRGTCKAIGYNAVVPGETYYYKLRVSAYGGVGLAAVQWACINPDLSDSNFLWTGALGTGDFEGQIVGADIFPAEPHIAMANAADEMTIDYLYIWRLKRRFCSPQNQRRGMF